MKFGWLPDPFESQDQQRQREKEMHTFKAEKTNPRPFNPAKNKKSHAYDYPFLGPNEKSVYSFLSSSDPYQAPIAERLRHQWVEESKILYGDFRHAGPQKPIVQVGRSKLKDIVESLKKILLSDWNDVNFVIGTNPNDFIEVKFDTANQDTVK